MFSISTGFFKFEKCQPPLFIKILLIYLVSEKKVSSLQNPNFLFLTFLIHWGDFKFFFLQALVPCHVKPSRYLFEIPDYYYTDAQLNYHRYIEPLIINPDGSKVVQQSPYISHGAYQDPNYQYHLEA